MVSFFVRLTLPNMEGLGILHGDRDLLVLVIRRLLHMIQDRCYMGND